MIAVDFETYYSRTHTVSTLGPWAYAHHPKTDIYMVSVVGEGIEFVGDPSDFDFSRLTGRDLVSHNAAFDSVVARAAISKGTIKQTFVPKSWSCSADLAAYCGQPRSLADAVKAVFGHELPKVMRQVMSGKSWQWAQDKGKAGQLLEYALNDSRWCLKLWEKLAPQWPIHERRLSAHTRTLQWRGVNVEADKLRTGITHLAELNAAAADKIPWAGDGAILSLPVLRDYCQTLGIPAPKSLAKDSDEAIAWEDKYGDRFEWIAALRDYRRTNILLQKLQAIDVRRRADGTMPVNLKYWGAHTGRWSGDAGVNMQNLPRSEMFNVNVRPMFMARSGHKFVIVDLSQIEPRVLYWLTGDAPMLDAIRSGVPLYEAHARATMGWTGGKMKDEAPDLYRLAKARVLGLGYGCGPGKFQHVAQALAGVTLDAAQCEDTVRQWRSGNERICKFWLSLTRKLGCGVNSQADHIEFGLPSGRPVRWWQPRLRIDETGTNPGANAFNGKGWTYLWGGKMTENIVQALARDVFADCVMRIEAHGIRVLWTVHDEVICEVPEDQADDALDTVTRIMSTPPDWISDLPLAAEGGIENHYAK